MTLADLVIMILLAVSAIVGLFQGFVRSLSALAGLVLGLTLACWNYHRPAKVLLPMVHSPALANAIGFVVITLTIMLILGFVGAVFAKALRFLGLGWIDMMGGAAFGLLEGAGLVTICIIVSIAFFPKSDWVAESRLTPMFFSLCDQAMDMSPSDIAKRVRDGMAEIQAHSPPWFQ
ncbi:MAG TPA: CvpA family protein [Terracidiphilus sp.]|nr:CvpA family protein [Terracidiphilus sp.]